MDGWMDGWMTNLSFKKKKTCTHVCILYRMIMNKEKEKKNSIKKENQSKQTKNTINSVANMQE